ncbi:MAG: ABC transporter ATP-binding protein [Phycisphaerales bacterium]|nr:ABC transporter ATP-binding protein [Phycisphaerales bacterium]
MKISVESVHKRFIQHNIFKGVSLDFESPQSYALLGANGSGKSTLLRIIAGMQSPTKGTVTFSDMEQPIAAEKMFRYISFCAPGMELIEEMTLNEMLQFHFSFKPILSGCNIDSVIELIGLKAASHQQIGNFSSGMKQRVKLAQAIFSNSPILLLDEPCTNLDQAGVAQYRQWIKEYVANRLLIIASNEEREYDFCQHQIKMDDYK